MRVVFAGNYNERKAGANFYGTIRKLTNGFVRNGHTVMPFSDRDAARESTHWRIGRKGVAEANRRLIEVCQQFRPDLLLLLHADKIANATLAEIKSLKPAPCIAYVNLDSLQLPHTPDRIRRFAEVGDATFTTTAGERLAEFASPTHRIAFIPNPVDRSIETLECFARTDQPFDLFCAIGGEKGTPWRAETMRAIGARVPEARCAFLGLAGTPALFGSEYLDAIAGARMGLNLNRRDGDYLYSSDRIAQYVGSGLLLFIGRATGYGDLFSDDEFVFYDGLDELADKLRYFLAHDAERRKVAEAGHAKYHALFNERAVARYIEDVTFGRAADCAWPTSLYGG